MPGKRAASHDDSVRKRPFSFSVQTSEACNALLKAFEWNLYGMPPAFLADRCKELVSPVCDEVKNGKEVCKDSAAKLLKEVYDALGGKSNIFKAMYNPLIDTLVAQLGGRALISSFRVSEDSLQRSVFGMYKCQTREAGEGQKELAAIFNGFDRSGNVIPLYFKRQNETDDDYGKRSDSVYMRGIEHSWPNAFVRHSFGTEHFDQLRELNAKRQSFVIIFTPTCFGVSFIPKDERYGQDCYTTLDLDGDKKVPALGGNWLWMNPEFLKATQPTIVVSAEKVRAALLSYAKKQCEIEGRKSIDECFPFSNPEQIVVVDSDTPAKWIERCRSGSSAPAASEMAP